MEKILILENSKKEIENYYKRNLKKSGIFRIN